MIGKTACVIACLCVLAQISLGENQLRPKSEVLKSFQSQARQLAEDDDDAFALKIPTVSPVTVNPPVMELPTREIPTPSIPQPTGNDDKPVAAPSTFEQASVRPTPSEDNTTPVTPATSDQPVLYPVTDAPVNIPEPIPSPATDSPTLTDGDSVPTPSKSENTMAPNNQETETSIPTIDMKDTETPTVDTATTERSSAPSLTETNTPTTAVPSTRVPSTTNPTSAKPSVSSTNTIAPSTIAPSSFAPSTEKTERPTEAPTEKTERPTEAPAEKTERPTEAPTEKTAVIPVHRTSFPTHAKVVVTDAPTTATPTTDAPTTAIPTTDIPTVAPSLEQTPAPSIDTGTGDTGNNDPQQGGSTDDPALDPDASSSSSVTFFLIAVILFVLYVLYRLYCKSGNTVTGSTGSGSGSTEANYSRLSTDELQGYMEDGLGDVEMAAHTAGYDDDAEIWEEWETNEEVNPPKTFLQAAAATAPTITPPPVRNVSSSSTGSSSGLHLGVKNSHSREDMDIGSTTANKGSLPSVPILAKPPSPVNTTGTTSTSGTLSSGLSKLKPTTATATSSSRSGKNRSVTTPPASDVDLFASIGIAAAPKFSNTSTLGGFPTSQNQTKSSTSSSRTVSTSKPIVPAVPVVLASAGPSRVSAVHIGSDSEGGGGTWDDDKELDDLIGED